MSRKGVKAQTYKSGTCLMLSEGEYSDYSVNGFLYVLRDINTRDVMLEYLTEKPEQKESYSARLHEFIAWLIEHQYAAEMPHEEWHIGSYGDFEIPEEA